MFKSKEERMLKREQKRIEKERERILLRRLLVVCLVATVVEIIL